MRFVFAIGKGMSARAAHRVRWSDGTEELVGEAPGANFAFGTPTDSNKKSSDLNGSSVVVIHKGRTSSGRRRTPALIRVLHKTQV